MVLISYIHVNTNFGFYQWKGKKLSSRLDNVKSNKWDIYICKHWWKGGKFIFLPSMNNWLLSLWHACFYFLPEIHLSIYINIQTRLMSLLGKLAILHSSWKYSLSILVDSGHLEASLWPDGIKNVKCISDI